MVGCDLIIGMLLGLVAMLRSDDDFASWRHLKKLKVKIAKLDMSYNELAATYQVAAKNCMAGILRAQQFVKVKHVPYFKVFPVIAFVMFSASEAFTQRDGIQRNETILIDVSGSIAKKGQAREQFADYLAGAKRLLASEPPSSNVWVQIITTDSFGGARTLLKGWTPGIQGVFQDALNRARGQLVQQFQTRAAALTPVAAGTDIFGSLWRAKTSMESDSAGKKVPTELHVFSDMVVEVPGFAMPALLPLGAEHMLELAKNNGLIVPLAGYRVQVYGASTTAMSPEAWNTIRAFWTMYLQAAGSELVTYSSETTVSR